MTSGAHSDRGAQVLRAFERPTAESSEATYRYGVIFVIILTLVMFEIVATKLPHYLLPVFPPLAFLTADAIVRCLNRVYGDLLTLGTRVAIGVWATTFTHARSSR